MVRRTGFAFVLLAGALAFAPSLLAANLGTALSSGDKSTGTIDIPGDEDSFLVGVVAGGGLSAKLKAAKGASLIPGLRVLRPDGTSAPLDGLIKGAGKPSVTLKPVAATATGGWALVVSGSGGTVGDYELAVKATGPKGTLKALLVPANGALDLPFGGTTGGVLSFQVKETSGAPIDGVVVLDPAGDVMDFPDALVTRKGAVLKGSNIVLEGGPGLYTLRLDGSASGASEVDVKIKVKVGKDARRTVILGPEPRPASFTPASGPDGAAVTITGAGFVDGAAVYFGNEPSTSVTVDSATQITCTAPKSAQSDAGSSVPLRVVNTDGQEGTAPNSFVFLGIPAVLSVSPAYQPLAGGSTITVTGSRFRPGFGMTLAGNPVAGATLQNSTQITFTAPARPEGAAAVAVTDEFGRTATLLTGIQYVTAPTITSASPDSASFTGGRPVTLTGTRYRTGVRVFMDGTEVLPVTILSTTSLRFPMPAGDAGTFDVEVRDEFAQASTATGLLSRRGPFLLDGDAVPASPAGNDFLASTGALGDLDHDGNPDLVLAREYAPYYYDPVTYTGTYLPASHLLMNDGGGNFSDGTEDRNGTFSDPGDFGQGSSVAMGDLDGDDRPEVLLSLGTPLASPDYMFLRNAKYYAYYIAIPGGGYTSDYRTYTATRRLDNDGSGYLSNATASGMPSSSSTPLYGFGERWQGAGSALGDLDGDGDLDVVLASAPVVNGYVAYTYKGGVAYYLQQQWTYLAGTRVLRNAGGVLAPVASAFPALTYTTGNYGVRIREDWGGDAVALGDLDGDSDLDMIVARSQPAIHYVYNAAASTYYIYYDQASRFLRNGGSGTFTDASSSFGSNYAATHLYSLDYGQADCVAIGDLDGDGDLDVVLGRDTAGYWYDAATQSVKLSPAIRILRNSGGTFTEATGDFLPDASFIGGSSTTILSARSVQLGDLDGDASPDLVVAGSIYKVFAYNSSGYGYYGIMPAGYRSASRVLVNDGAGNFTDVTSSWMPSPYNGDYGQSSFSLVGDLDGDGDGDLVLGSAYYPYSYYGTYGQNRPLRVLKTE